MTLECPGMIVRPFVTDSRLVTVLGLQVLCRDVVMLCYGSLSLVVCTFLCCYELQVFCSYFRSFPRLFLRDSASSSVCCAGYIYSVDFRLGFV